MKVTRVNTSNADFNSVSRTVVTVTPDNAPILHDTMPSSSSEVTGNGNIIKTFDFVVGGGEYLPIATFIPTTTSQQVEIRLFGTSTSQVMQLSAGEPDVDPENLTGVDFTFDASEAEDSDTVTLTGLTANKVHILYLNRKTGGSGDVEVHSASVSML